MGFAANESRTLIEATTTDSQKSMFPALSLSILLQRNQFQFPGGSEANASASSKEELKLKQNKNSNLMTFVVVIVFVFLALNILFVQSRMNDEQRPLLYIFDFILHHFHAQSLIDSGYCSLSFVNQMHSKKMNRKKRSPPHQLIKLIIYTQREKEREREISPAHQLFLSHSPRKHSV